jgi:uncharacterized Zn finger protein
MQVVNDKTVICGKCGHVNDVRQRTISRGKVEYSYECDDCGYKASEVKTIQAFVTVTKGDTTEVLPSEISSTRRFKH